LQWPSRRYRSPATPTILAFRTITDSRQFAQYPTRGVFVDGSNDHAADARAVALESMG